MGFKSPEKAFELSPKLTNIVLTNGGNSAQFLSSSGHSETIKIPAVKTLRSPIGAGDAVAAGMAAAIQNDMPIREAFLYGLKLGAAACQVSGCNGFDEEYLSELTK
jgi:fructose-1-phosphate kinase PfkB-like protein